MSDAGRASAMATKLRTMPRWADQAALGRAMRAWRDKAAESAGILWRHKLPILGCIVVVLGFTAAYVSGRTPVYRAITLVALEEGSTGQGAPVQDGNLEDQLRLIESRAMAEQLVERLNLHFVPEFQPDMTAGSRQADPWLPPPILEWLPQPFAATLGAGPAEGEMTDEQRAARLRNQVIEAAMLRTRAEAVRPLVLGLQFVSADPQLAAAGANALAELYLEERQGLRREGSEGDHVTLAEEIERLRASIRETEQAIEASRASADAATAQPSEQTLLDLTGELAFWRRERAEVEVRLRQAEAALESGAALDLAALAIEAERLGGLQGREAELEQALMALSQQHGEDDPQVVELRTDLEALQTDKRSEIELIVSRLRNEIEIIRSRETALETEIKGLEGQAAQDEAAGGEDVLEQKLQAERAQLQDRLERLEQSEPRASGSLPDAQIIAPAVAPDEPFQPRLAMIYGAAFAGGLLLGFLVAFGLESVHRARA